MHGAMEKKKGPSASVASALLSLLFPYFACIRVKSNFLRVCFPIFINFAQSDVKSFLNI